MNCQLTLIIVSYNTKQLLRQTLKSIPSHEDWEIIVIDNHSTDGTIAILENDFSHLHLIKNDTNLGFAKANNLGIKIARGEYVMLLNSDTVIQANAIDKLLAYMDTHTDVGAITPKVILPDGAIDLACHRGLPTPWNAFTYFSKLESLLPTHKLFSGYHQTYKDFDTAHQIDATAMTALVMRKSVIDEIGPLDERFFLYGEDLDWCKRLTDAGYRIIYYPDATIFHHKSASGKKKHPQDKESQALRRQSHHHFYDTMKQFYEKHYQTKYPPWLRQLVYFGIDLKKKLHS